MPLYEYECTACHRHTEKIQKFSDTEITECPHCEGKLQRVLSAPAISFKGGGWYKDLYSSAKPASANGSESSRDGNKEAKDGSKETKDGSKDSKAGTKPSGEGTSAPAAAPSAAPASSPAAAPASSSSSPGSSSKA